MVERRVTEHFGVPGRSARRRAGRPRAAQRALARDFPPDRRELSGDRRAGRLAQSRAHHPDDAVAGLGPQRHGDLEQLGLIYAPHTSAGRLPTERGLRFFVDALMQVGDLTEDDRQAIEAQVAAAGTSKSVEAVLTEASGLLSGPDARGRRGAGGQDRTRGSSISSSCGSSRSARWSCWSPRTGRSRTASSTLPPGLPTSALTEATNFLNAHIRGRTLAEARAELERALEAGKAELDQLTQKIVAAGLASWSGGESEERKLIVRGQAPTCSTTCTRWRTSNACACCSTISKTKRGVADLLGRAEQAEGVRIFIGSENKLFSLSGSSTIVSPYRDGQGRIVGVIGVIGPTRLNYARIIPMVDYTAQGRSSKACWAG